MGKTEYLSNIYLSSKNTYLLWKENITNTSISDIGFEYTWDSKHDFGNNTTLYTEHENMGFSGIRSLMEKCIFNTNTYTWRMTL